MGYCLPRSVNWQDERTCLSEVLFLKSEYLFIKSEYLFAKSEYLFAKSEYLFVKSEYLFTKSEYLFVKSEYVFKKPEYLTGRVSVWVSYQSQSTMRAYPLNWIVPKQRGR